MEHEKHMVGIPKICPILEPCGFHQYLISEETVYIHTFFFQFSGHAMRYHLPINNFRLAPIILIAGRTYLLDSNSALIWIFFPNNQFFFLNLSNKIQITTVKKKTHSHSLL